MYVSNKHKCTRTDAYVRTFGAVHATDGVEHADDSLAHLRATALQL